MPKAWCSPLLLSSGDSMPAITAFAQAEKRLQGQRAEGGGGRRRTLTIASTPFAQRRSQYPCQPAGYNRPAQWEKRAGFRVSSRCRRRNRPESLRPKTAV